MIWTILSLIAAVLCYTVSQLQQHGKLRWSKNDMGFWGEKSHIRKYKRNGEYVIFMNYGEKNWYHKLFNLNAREVFPLSTTLLVAFTDGYHLSQMFFKLFLALSFAPLTGWIWAGVIWLLWGISFTIFYRLLSR